MLPIASPVTGNRNYLFVFMMSVLLFIQDVGRVGYPHNGNGEYHTHTRVSFNIVELFINYRSFLNIRVGQRSFTALTQSLRHVVVGTSDARVRYCSILL